jgi:trimethylamine:corrinoid methyltransferase-like protein
VELPAMQMEMFAEAGAIVAERAVAVGAGRELVAGILRRAAEQAVRLVGGGPREPQGE